MGHLALTSLVAGVLLAADVNEDEAVRKDLQQLRGSWQLTNGVYDGKRYSELEVKQSQIVFDGNRYSLPASAVGISQTGTIKIDATTKPKQLEFRPALDPDMGKTFLGIYELEGDTYKVCFAPPGKERPKEFVSEPFSGYTLHIWKRVKR
jgi:uncharacterized protein (TIGR03067 family)